MPRPRTRLDPDERREQILAAAMRSFREQPYGEVSLDDIAGAAGVTRGLLHHYYGSKRALFLVVLERAVKVPSSLKLVPDDAGGDLRAVIAASVVSWMRLIRQAGGLWSGAVASGFGEDDIDAVLTVARDDLVNRMVDELPFPPDLDRDLLRSALRAYAAFARVASDEWLSEGALDEAQVEALLRETLIALIETVVPAMGSGSS